MRLIALRAPDGGSPADSAIRSGDRLRSRLACTDSNEHVEFSRSLAIGRDPRNDLVLGQRQVSGRHAVLVWREGGWRIRDLGSRNGTTVNGRRIHDWQSVRIGDVLRFGGESSWRVEMLVEPGHVEAAIAFVEDLASDRWLPMCSDRFLVGTGDPCDLVVPEWLPDPASAIRLVLFEESGQLWMAVGEDGRGIELDGEPFPGEPVAVQQTHRILLGERRIAVFPAEQTDLVAPTVSAMRRTKQYDVALRMRFIGPGEGVIEADHGGRTITVHGEQRFVLMVLLARAAGEWVIDDDLRAGLWGRMGALERDPSALGKLIYDTRKAFTAKGLDGWFIEKARGRTRLRLDPGGIEIIGDR